MSQITCNHTLTRGPNMGSKCSVHPIQNSEYCSRHTKHKKIGKKIGKKIEKDPCPICLDEIKDKNCCTLDCGHEFHLPCIFQLFKQFTADFNNKCPLCRTEFTEKVLPAQTQTFIFMRNISNDDDDDTVLTLPDEPLERQQAVSSPAQSPLHIPSLALSDLPPPAPLRRQRAIPIDNFGQELPSFQFMTSLIEFIDSTRNQQDEN